MGNPIPLTSFEMAYRDGKLVVLLDGQPLNMHLLQKVEVVIDAQLMQPFVRLTAQAGDTGVKLGNTLLEMKLGDPSKATFEKPPASPPYHGHGCVGPTTDGHQDTNERDLCHGQAAGQHHFDDPSAPGYHP